MSENNLVVSGAGETGSVLSLVASTDLLTHVVAKETVAGSKRDETHTNDKGVDLRGEHLVLLALGSGAEKHRSAHF